MSRPGPDSAVTRGGLLLAVLLCASIAAFAVTRAMRASDDIVNSVVVSPRIAAGQTAAIRFGLARSDSRADVHVVTGPEGKTVRTLARGERLAEGTHRFEWDGLREDGRQAPPGPYRLRIVLGEQDRDIEPPGTIEVVGEPEP